MVNKYERRDNSPSFATLAFLAVLGAGIALYGTVKGISDRGDRDRAGVSASVERSYTGRLEDEIAEINDR